MNAPAHTIDKADEAQLLATIDRWVEREVAPRVKEFDHADRWPAELVEQMKELGLFGATVSPDYGGLGLPARTYAEIVMRISSVWMALTGIFNSHLMLALAIEKFGTEPQKRHWLPKLASGEVRGGLALTEPDAGTDLQAIRLTARRDGDHYVLNGTKTWISNGIEGSCFALLVKTDPQAQPRYSGMSLFIAPKGPGFRVGRKLEKLGYKSIDSAELIFEDYRVPADHLIGEVEGRGFTQVAGGLELGRINVAARGVGIAEGALQLATSYAQLRKTFGKPICEHQAIQLKLGEMATRARAARLLTLDAADAFDRGERCDLEAGMAKYFASEAALENSIEVDAHPRRLRLLQGVRHRAPLSRRAADLHRRGHQRDAAHHHRPAMDQAAPHRMSAKPLAGVRVLTLEQFGAGPYGTMFLAELGAEVIKVEAPDGDPSRHVGPHKLGAADSEYFQAWNLGKKSVTIDLKSIEGRRAVRGAGEDRRLRGQQPARHAAGQARHRLCEPETSQALDRLPAHLGLWPRQRTRRLAGLRLPDAGRGRADGADRRARRAADPRRRVDDRQHERPDRESSACSPACCARGRRARAATSRPASTTWPCTSSPIPASGTSTRATSRRGCRAARTCRWRRSRPSRPRTAGSSSCA